MNLRFNSSKDGRLDVLLTEAAAKTPPTVGFSRAAVQRAIRGGLVRVESEPITDPAAKIRLNQAITAVLPMPPPQPGAGEGLKPQKVRFRVVFEDEYLIVVDKPTGLVVHPGAGNPDNTLANGLLEHCRGKLSAGRTIRPGIVHRLDKNTSGLLVAAKEERTHAALARQFERRLAKRLYWAATLGVPSLSGLVDAPLARNPRNRLKMAVMERGKAAKTRWRRLRAFYDPRGRPLVAFVACSLMSGRTHQIRAHLASIGKPLLGDELYGGKAAAKWLNRQALHAVRLGFIHPHTGRRLRFKSPLADDLVKLVNDLPCRLGDGKLRTRE